MKVKILLTIGFSMIFALISAQNVRNISYDNSHNGLSNDLVKGICKDDLGFIWVATDDGLSRFDGLSFQTFTEGLPSKYTKSIIKTKSGFLLVSTDLGIVKIISKPDTAIITTIIPGNNQITDSTVHYPKLLFEDSNGNIWITDDMSVILFKDDIFKRYTFDKKVSSTSYHRTFTVVENSFGNLFAFSQNGYSFYFDKQADKFSELPNISKFENISFALAIENGSILIASSSGIYELKVDDQYKIISLKNIFPEIDASYLICKNENSYLVSTWDSGIYEISKKNDLYEIKKFQDFPFNRTNFLYQDNNNNLFVGTDAGIILSQFNFFSAQNSKMSEDYIMSIHISDNNDAWITTGGKIYTAEYKENDIVFNQFNAPPISGSYTNVFPSKNQENTQWISSNSGILYFIVNEKIDKTFDFTDIGRNISHCFEDTAGNVWASLDGFEGVIKISNTFQEVKYDSIKGLKNQIIIIKQRKDGVIFGGSLTVDNYLYYYDNEKDKFIDISKPLDFEPKIEFYINDIAFEGDNIWLATSDGLLKMSDSTIQRIELGEFTDNLTYSVSVDKRGNIWFANSRGIFKYSKNALSFFNQENGLSTITASYCCFITDNFNHLWLGTALGLNFAENLEDAQISTTPIITSVKVNKNKIKDYFTEFELTQGSYLTVNYIPVAFPGDEVIFQYKLSHENEEWTDVNSKTELILPNLATANYQMQIRAKQQGNYYWSEPCTLNFKIVPPWFRTWWAILLYFILAFLIVYIAVNLNSRRLKAANLKLEKIVKDRTSEVVMKNSILQQQKEEILTQNEALQQQKEEILTQNEALQQQKEEITAQRDEIELRNEELFEKNSKIENQHKKIQDSITYASRIQSAVLPKFEILENNFSDNLVLWKPRDVVSGDFYWFKQIDNIVFIAAADCTGHGVPGAFMSMLGISFLNEIVTKREINTTNQVLNELRKLVKLSLNQTGQRGDNQDGMDIAFCAFDTISKKLQFSGANNPLWIINLSASESLDKTNLSASERPDSVENMKEIKPDRMPIGVHPRDNQEFTLNEVQLHKGDIFYIFSDGYESQFGGEKNETMKTRRFQEIIQRNCNKTLAEQKNELEKEFDIWKGNNEQIDDVLVIGIKI